MEPVFFETSLLKFALESGQRQCFRKPTEISLFICRQFGFLFLADCHQIQRRQMQKRIARYHTYKTTQSCKKGSGAPTTLWEGAEHIASEPHYFSYID